MGVDAEYPIQMLGSAQKSCWGGKEGLEEPQGSGTQYEREHSLQNQLTRTHGNLSDQGTVGVWPRSFTYIVVWVAWCFCGNPNSGSRDCPWLLATCGTLSPLLGSLVQPRCDVCAWSQCRVLRPVRLMSLGGLLFSAVRGGGLKGKGRQERDRVGTVVKV